MHDDFRSLSDVEGGAGDRAVVAEHPNGAVVKPFGDRSNAKVQRVAVGELENFRRRGLGEAGGIGREMTGREEVMFRARGARSFFLCSKGQPKLEACWA